MSNDKLDKMIASVENKTYAKSSNSISFFEIKRDGEYRFQFIEIVEGKYPTEEVFLHNNFPHPTKKGSTTVLRCGGKDCPLCKIAKAEPESVAWKKKCRLFYLYLVADGKGKLHFLKVTKALHEKIEEKWLGFAKNERTNIFDLKAGRVINIVRRTNSGKTHWSVSVGFKEHPLSDELIKQVQGKIHLDRLFKTYTNEQLADIASGKKIASAELGKSKKDTGIDFKKKMIEKRSSKAEPVSEPEIEDNNPNLPDFDDLDLGTDDDLAAMRREILGDDSLNKVETEESAEASPQSEPEEIVVDAKVEAESTPEEDSGEDLSQFENSDELAEMRQRIFGQKKAN